MDKYPELRISALILVSGGINPSSLFPFMLITPITNLNTQPMHPINLASGLSCFPTPEKATTAATIALQADVAGQYGPTEGIRALREAIAGRYSAEDMVTGAEQILVTPGSKMALFNLFSVLLQEGDEVVVPTPAWFGFEELLKYSKGRLVALPTSPESGYSLTPEALRSTLTLSWYRL